MEYVNDNGQRSAVYMAPAEKTVNTTIPFVKNNEFNYHWLVPGDSERADLWTWLVYVVIATLVITAVSNGANLTDGLDGLASGVSATIVVTLGILAYLSGNVIYADYLNIMYIPMSGELIVYAAAFAGALFGFFVVQLLSGAGLHGRYRQFGDRRNHCRIRAADPQGVAAADPVRDFFSSKACRSSCRSPISNIRKNGTAKAGAFFLMSPLHHHFQKKGYFESKIVVRFWIVQLLLAAITLVTLKIR